jgi:hypothetical protein
MTVMQFLEVFLPLIKQRLKLSKEEQKQAALLQAGGVPAAELTLEEQQARLEMYEGVFQEYQEMVVQFGCVCVCVCVGCVCVGCVSRVPGDGGPVQVIVCAVLSY